MQKKKMPRGTKRLRHGSCIGTPTKTYAVWASAVDRCENPNSPDFQNYGGRGISMCRRWRDDFSAFVTDMGEKPANRSLDRIDNNGNYEPSNCRWATIAEQARNRRNNIRVRLEDGSEVILKDYADMHGVNYYCMYARHMRGKPLLKHPR